MATMERADVSVEEDSVVYVYDRRKGSEPERKITLGGVFSFHDFKDLIQKEFNIPSTSHFVIATTNRDEIDSDQTYEDLVEDGDTLYLLQHIKQALPAPTQERVEYQPHFDTLIRSGMYEYYASAGQNPLPFAFAELIDNSLAATMHNVGSRTIEIRLYLDETGEKSMVTVMDNGKGMTSRELNHWAIYRLSKFVRKKRKGDKADGHAEKEENVPRSLNSDISYFGVGGKQAIFFIGHATRMITKPKDSKDVHELAVSRDEFERREKNREAIYSGYIRNRQPGENKHILPEDENLHKLIKEEIGKESFTHVIITGIGAQHIKFLKEDFVGWSKQLAHIYHYYIHGPLGNVSHESGSLVRAPSPFRNIDISITMYKKGHTPRQVNLRDIDNDQQSNFIRSGKDSFEFRIVVEGNTEGTGLVEGILRYHPFLYDRETFPVDTGPSILDPDEYGVDYNHQDRPARGNRPIFECYWNGRLIPYTLVDDFEWCAAPKKRGPIPIECYNRISGVLFANDKFQVSTNKLTFTDLELKLKEKNAIFEKMVAGQPQRANVPSEFTDWLKECHKNLDKQIRFGNYVKTISRPELPKRQQSPWAVYKTIEWDGRIFSAGQLGRTQRTSPIIHGTIQRFLLYGHYEGEVFATGGEFEVCQEPKLMYSETKTYPLSKLDRVVSDRQIKKFIEDEEGKLPETITVTWPEGNEVLPGEKRAAGKLIGAIQAEIQNRKGQAISRMPGSQHSSKKLLVEMKIIWHSTSGDKTIVTHMSQHHKNWAFWFRQMDIVRDLGNYTLKLQTVINEEGGTHFGGRLLPCHKIKFSITEAPPSKFCFGYLDPPFRVDVPFSIPLNLQDEFSHPTKPTPGLKPVLEADGLDLVYERIEAKGTTLLVKNVKASGDVGSSQGKNFTLKVTIPELEKPSQQVKIRLLPGEPHKIIVPTFDAEELSVENGKAMTVAVEIRDRAGNISMHPKLVVNCKFTGVSGLPTYTADCSNSGKASLTGKPINIKNISKKSQKITAQVSLPSQRDVPAVEKTVTVRPSTSPCNINVFYQQHAKLKEGTAAKPVKMKPQEEIEWTAGEQTTGIVFALFDEGGTHLRITPELASKFKFNWLPRYDPAVIMQGSLPPIHVPNTVGDTRFCQLNLTDGSGLEFSFSIKPIPGEPTQIKCVHKGNKKLRLGETLDPDITVHVTDAYGNSMKKLPHGALSNFSVTALDLDTKAIQKALLANVGFVIRNVRFEGSGVGPREITVKYKDYTDYVRLELLAGKPSKLAVVGWNSDETMIAYSGSQLSRPLIFQICDESDNISHDVNCKAFLQHDKALKVTSTMPTTTTADSNGKIDFGKLTFQGPCGKYKLSAKVILGRTSLVSTPLHIQISPDPNNPDHVKVDFKKKNTHVAGEHLPDFDVSVIAEDGSTMTNVLAKNVVLRLWKKGTESGPPTIPPPSRALITNADNHKSGNESGHFYFRQRKLPQEASTHYIVFQAAIGKEVLYSSPLTINVQPGPPHKLLPEVMPATPTVSNTPRSYSRTLIKSMKLYLIDAYNNRTGENMSGTLDVQLKGDDNTTEIPKLQGNKSTVQYPFTKGSVLVQNISIQENTPGRDGYEYSLHFKLNCKGVQVAPYIQPFLFYNDAKKQQRMAQLSKERDTLSTSIATYKDLFQRRQQLLNMFKDAVEDAKHKENKIRDELKWAGLKPNQTLSKKGVDQLTVSLKEKVKVLKNKSRRLCGIDKYDTHDKDVLGKIAHLAEVHDENEAFVLSWHMASDMDCVLTTTMAKAKEIYSNTRGRQQVLSVDSIFRKGLTEWDKPLPHKRVPMKSCPQPAGNPIYARHLLKFTAHEDFCKLAFSLLLGDTMLLDTLDDATAYRQLIVKYAHCPTLLTRDGNRMRGNGKFGGLQNRCPTDLRGHVFGEPLPAELPKLSKQIELLEQVGQAITSREAAEGEYKAQQASANSPDMMSQRKDCQEAEEQLALIQEKLKLASSGKSHNNNPIPMEDLSQNNSRSRSSNRTSPIAARGTTRRAGTPLSDSPRSKRRKP